MHSFGERVKVDGESMKTEKNESPEIWSNRTTAERDNWNRVRALISAQPI